MENGNLLEVNDLRIQFSTDRGVIRALEGVDFFVRKQEVWGLWENLRAARASSARLWSGSLQSRPAGSFRGALFQGQDILQKSSAEMQKIRGNEIAFIPQDPTTALNPLLTVGFQIAEAFKYHRGIKRHSDTAREILKVMQVVNIPSPEQRVRDYPHQLSGGLKQRVIIATALSCQPDLLIADEPTSALDVTIQMQIIKLIREIQEHFQMAIILITHNLGLVARMCDRVAVLYCGRIVEEAATRDLFKSPRHPYTKGLLASLPKGAKGKVELYTVPGQLPNPLYHPPGCHFALRCAFKKEKCEQAPSMEWISEDHRVRCWRWREF